MDFNNTNLVELRKRAEKVADLIDLLNDTFPNYLRENIILAISACIQDAYGQGIYDASRKKKLKE